MSVSWRPISAWLQVAIAAALAWLTADREGFWYGAIAATSLLMACRDLGDRYRNRRRPARNVVRIR